MNIFEEHKLVRAAAHQCGELLEEAEAHIIDLTMERDSLLAILRDIYGGPPPTFAWCDPPWADLYDRITAALDDFSRQQAASTANPVANEKH